MPADLPAIAMDSAVLFHLERALVTIIALVAVLTIVVRGSNREVPLQLTASGVQYQEPESRSVVGIERALQQTAERLAEVEQAQSDLGTGLAELDKELREGRRR